MDELILKNVEGANLIVRISPIKKIERVIGVEVDENRYYIWEKYLGLAKKSIFKDKKGLTFILI